MIKKDKKRKLRSRIEFYLYCFIIRKKIKR